jgi:hypothetical protein
MDSQSPEVRFTCLNDCRLEGCPSHTVRAVYSHVSDMLAFEFDDGSRQVFDENQFVAMMAVFQSIKW